MSRPPQRGGSRARMDVSRSSPRSTWTVFAAPHHFDDAARLTNRRCVRVPFFFALRDSKRFPATAIRSFDSRREENGHPSARLFFVTAKCAQPQVHASRSSACRAFRETFAVGSCTTKPKRRFRKFTMPLTRRSAHVRTTKFSLPNGFGTYLSAFGSFSHCSPFTR